MRSSTPPTSDRSQRKLSEVAKRLAVPRDIVSTSWGPVSDTCRDKMGIEFDGWQDGLGKLLLARNSSGAIAHTVGGFGLSAMRQIGKTYFYCGAFFGMAQEYPGLLVVWSAHHGKALDCQTEMLTANRGWITLADIEIGDQVFHPSGNRVSVEAVKDVLIGNNCYEVTMSDGRSIIADAEHLWTVTDYNYKLSSGAPPNRRRWQGPSRTLTTSALLEAGLKSPRGRNRFALPRQDRICDLPERPLPIDPYLLGAWLGDGSSTSANLTCAAADLTHWCREIGKAGYLAVARKPANRAWRIAIKAPGNAGHRSRCLVGKLTALGVLGNKHVPDEYLTSSVSQRLALLQGLLDTDGTINAQGNVYFTSTKRELSEAVAWVVRSLGWRATLKEGKATLDSKDCGPVWTVTFTPKLSDGLIPFRLPRKVSRIGEIDNNNGRFTITIDSIEPVASRPVRCIKVSAEDGLFLAGRDLIPTHNTHAETFLSMQAFASRRQVKPFIRDVYTGSGDESVVFHNGSRILFGARERGFGRGVPGVDVLMNDEGQILSEKAVDAMLATLNVSDIGIHVYAGTPPKPEDNSEKWMRMRDEAWAIPDPNIKQVETEDIVWVEIGAADDADLDDEDQWAANPSYPHRTPRESILRLRRNLKDEGFRREGLGLYDKAERSVFDMAKWAALADKTAPPPEEVALVVDVSPDRRWACIAVCGDLDDERDLVIIKSIRGTNTLAAEVDKLREDRNVDNIAITGGAARSIEGDLTELGIDYEVITANELSAAFATLQEKIKSGGVVHADQQELTFAMANARSRYLQTGEAEAFDRRDYSLDMSPAVAAAAALYRWSTSKSPLPFIL